MPIVSILMTAYNRQKYIAESIESVLAINFQDWELIIVDDCSADDTVNIIKSYLAKDNRIRFYINEKNLGDYPNRNKAASYAQGKYLIHVDSDDTMFPEGLDRWVHHMEQQQAKFGMVGYVNQQKPVIFGSEEAIQYHFFTKPLLICGPSGTITDRLYFLEHNGFPVKYGPANDMYQHLKMASAGRVLLFNFPVISYRLHEDQELNNSYGYLYHNYNFMDDALKEINMPVSKKQAAYISKKNKRRFLVNISRYVFKTGNFKKAWMAVRQTNFGIKDIFLAVFH